MKYGWQYATPSWLPVVANFGNLPKCDCETQSLGKATGVTGRARMAKKPAGPSVVVSKRVTQQQKARGVYRSMMDAKTSEDDGAKPPKKKGRC